MTISANIIGPEDGNPFNYLGTIMDWKITSRETAGALSLVEARGSPGTEPPLHYHENADEFFYLIDAQMTFKVGDEIRRISSGGFVWIPRETVHGFIIHVEHSRFLFGFVPAGLEQMFMTIRTSSTAPLVAEMRDVIPNPSHETDAHRARYGTIVVGPRLGNLIGQQTDPEHNV